MGFFYRVFIGFYRVFKGEKVFFFGFLEVLWGKGSPGFVCVV